MRFRGRYLLATVTAAVCIGLIGCTGAGELTPAQQNDIVDGANTIVLTRMDAGETLGRTSLAMDLYTDAVRELQNSGYEMAAMDADQLVFRTEPRVVEPGLALQISGKVRQDNVGAKLLASARHAPSATSSDWQDVVFSDGSDDGPFAATYLEVSGIAHDEIGTSVE